MFPAAPERSGKKTGFDVVPVILNGMPPPFGITMLRSFTFRHHDVAIVSLPSHRSQGLIGFANVAMDILFDNLSLAWKAKTLPVCFS